MNTPKQNKTLPTGYLTNDPRGAFRRELIQEGSFAWVCRTSGNDHWVIDSDSEPFCNAEHSYERYEGNLVDYCTEFDQNGHDRREYALYLNGERIASSTH